MQKLRIAQVTSTGFGVLELTPVEYAWFVHLRQRVRWAWGPL